MATNPTALVVIGFVAGLVIGLTVGFFFAMLLASAGNDS